MSLHDDLEAEVQHVVNVKWDERDAQVVPATDTVVLDGGLAKLTATVLYADLADSTSIARADRYMAARLFKAFLVSSSRLIRELGGSIRSFDGDRVMGVFIGDSKNSNAVKCGLQINYVFTKLVGPALETRYKSLRDGTHKLGHSVGIDTGEMYVVRAGIRNDNDLIWVGRAPNIAAKLSGIRDSPYNTWITEDVYTQLNAASKLAGEVDMWEVRYNSTTGMSPIYRSRYHWIP